ncbi:hypothetical protein DUNSADRAFT_15542 [Dunaliella salina]|uniref:PE-PGRS protein n=1 Tax=Dunaliella salina TaxID=3046 RepID=A0ABQ7G591_DUNSA|nr:hypothetical protein DUNSADRAFT_15542 [Dunaliella salina]|eukprot:KAF5829760.1 hypothetical protein DUNSADRAFT_15542 [Dunaliella salina]
MYYNNYSPDEEYFSQNKEFRSDERFYNSNFSGGVKALVVGGGGNGRGLPSCKGGQGGEVKYEQIILPRGWIDIKVAKTGSEGDTVILAHDHGQEKILIVAKGAQGSKGNGKRIQEFGRDYYVGGAGGDGTNMDAPGGGGGGAGKSRSIRDISLGRTKVAGKGGDGGSSNYGGGGGGDDGKGGNGGKGEGETASGPDGAKGGGPTDSEWGAGMGGKGKQESSWVGNTWDGFNYGNELIAGGGGAGANSGAGGGGCAANDPDETGYGDQVYLIGEGGQGGSGLVVLFFKDTLDSDADSDASD